MTLNGKEKREDNRFRFAAHGGCAATRPGDGPDTGLGQIRPGTLVADDAREVTDAIAGFCEWRGFDPAVQGRQRPLAP